MFSLNYLPVAKFATQIVAGLGVSKIVADIVKNNVTIATPAQAVTVKVGGFVLGSMLWEQSTNHIERAADDVVGFLKKKNLVKEETSTEA